MRIRQCCDYEYTIASESQHEQKTPRATQCDYYKELKQKKHMFQTASNHPRGPASTLTSSVLE